MNKMKLVDLKRTHKAKFLNSYDATYKNEDGHTKLYEIISRNPDMTVDTVAGEETSDAVGIIAFDRTGEKILLQKEFRMACNKWVYNFPGGLIDSGETPCEAAKRELKEETGLDLFKIVDTLPPAYSAVGISNESTMTVIGMAEGEFETSTSIDEDIEAKWYSKEEVQKILSSGESISLRTQSFLYLWSMCTDIRF